MWETYFPVPLHQGLFDNKLLVSLSVFMDNWQIWLKIPWEEGLFSCENLIPAEDLINLSSDFSGPYLSSYPLSHSFLYNF